MKPKRASIEEFMRIVDGATEETATYYLEMCSGNCKEAINLYYELHAQGVPEEPAASTTPPSVKGTKKSPKPVISTGAEQDEDFVRAPDKHFSQALIHDMDEANFLYSSKGKKKKDPVEIGDNDSLGRLFAPPSDIICKLTFDQVRKKAKAEDKYVLVNIQNSEFDSMRLNRDIWKHESIKQIISDFFIFWLRKETDQDAMVFMQAYKVTKLPYICALCKRTGRELKVWNARQFGDVICAQSQLYEFIETAEKAYAADSTKKLSYVSPSKPPSNITTTTNTTTAAPNIRKTESASSKEEQITGKEAHEKKKDKQALKAVVKTVSKAENKNNTNKREDTKSPFKKETRKTDTLQKRENTITEIYKPVTQQTTKSETPVTTETPPSEIKLKDIPLMDRNNEYNMINNELLELHRLRLERMKKK